VNENVNRALESVTFRLEKRERGESIKLAGLDQRRKRKPRRGHRHRSRTLLVHNYLPKKVFIPFHWVFQREEGKEDKKRKEKGRNCEKSSTFYLPF
jgi:hypothetical protein